MNDAPRPDPSPPTLVPSDEDRTVSPNFVTEVVDRDLRSGRVSRVVTRFPPEPNGYLHIGHAKAICLDFGLARDYGGRVHLRMDDTNPTTEDPAFVAAIERDVHWLGFRWDELRYASDYFEELYAMAERLVERGDAYVDLRDEATIRATRGSVTEPGTPSADRDRSPDENLSLFRRMRAGAFADGAAVLRARIDLTSPNMILRDPVLYRIKHAHHYRTGDAWCLYPLYDYAHPLSDAIEGITHSLCTLEFDNNRAIYDWLVERLFEEPRPRQYEFARLQLDRTVLSKRKLIALVREGHVEGWDDPRMPTLAGVRRRGVPPEALRAFVDRIGVTKANSRTDPALLDHAVRDVLNTTAPRVMAVLDPVELLLADPEAVLDGIDGVDAPSFPDDVTAVVGASAETSRLVPLGRRLWIERADVALDPPAGFKRLAPGRAVRLRHAVVVHCDRIELGADGAISRVHARVLPGSLSSNPPGVKIWAAIHWVDVETGVPAELRLYDHLFAAADPDADGDFRQHLATASIEVRRGYVEPSVLADPLGTRYQFERQGYFWRDPEASDGDATWHRIVTLKDGRVATAPAGAAPVRAAHADAAADDPVAALAPAERTAAEAWVAAGVAPADAAVVVGDAALAELLAASVAAGAEARAAAPWVVQDARRLLREREGGAHHLDGRAIAELLRLLAEGVLHAGSARTVLAAVADGEGRPAEVVAKRGLSVADAAGRIEATVRQIIDAHPAEAASYRGGKLGLAGFFVGEAMRALAGRAEPKAVQAAVRRLLDGVD